MYYVIDLIFFSCLLYISYRIFTNTISQNIAGIAASVVAVVVSSFTFWAFRHFVSYLFDNFVLQILVSATISMLMFFTTWYILKKRWSLFIAKKFEMRFCIRYRSISIGKSLNVLLLVAYLLVMFLVADFLVQAMSYLPQEKQLASGSFLLGRMFTPFSQPIEEGTPMIQFPSGSEQRIAMQETEHALYETMEEQSIFWRGLRREFQKTRDFFSQKTGSKIVLAHLKIVKELFELSEEEKTWLVQTTPALQHLVDNASLWAVIEDQRLLELIEEASQGSVSALYQLGEEPLMQALFDDQEIILAVRQIQLQALLQKVKARQRQFLVEIRPDIWLFETIQSTLEFQDHLNTWNRWKKAELKNDKIVWPTETRFGVAGTTFHIPVKSSGEIYLYTKGRVIATMLNGYLLDMQGNLSGQFARVDFPRGTSELHVLVNFMGVRLPKSCKAEIFYRISEK